MTSNWEPTASSQAMMWVPALNCQSEALIAPEGAEVLRLHIEDPLQARRITAPRAVGTGAITGQAVCTLCVQEEVMLIGRRQSSGRQL
jgi:hypothetical protein